MVTLAGTARCTDLVTRTDDRYRLLIQEENLAFLVDRKSADLWFALASFLLLGLSLRNFFLDFGPGPHLTP